MKQRSHLFRDGSGLPPQGSASAWPAEATRAGSVPAADAARRWPGGWQRPRLCGRSLAHAAGSPMRLVCWPMMNGAESGAFYPGGSATQLSMITEPLRKYASLVTFIKGVNISGSSNHYAVRSTYSGVSNRQLRIARPHRQVGRPADRRLHRRRRAHDAQVAAPGRHPGRLDQLLPARGPLDLLLRAQAGRLRSQPGHRVRSGLRRRPALERAHAHVAGLHQGLARPGRRRDDRAEHRAGHHHPQRGQQADPAQGILVAPAAQGADRHAPMGGMAPALLASVEKLRPTLQGKPATPTSASTSATCSTPRSTTWRAR